MVHQIFDDGAVAARAGIGIVFIGGCGGVLFDGICDAAVGAQHDDSGICRGGIQGFQSVFPVIQGGEATFSGVDSCDS